MAERLYGWIQDITVYLIVMSSVMHVISGNEYEKYIRFFSGLVLILLIFTPVLKITGMEETFADVYTSEEYKIEKEEIENVSDLYKAFGFSDARTEENGQIEVGEILIGE